MGSSVDEVRMSASVGVATISRLLKIMGFFVTEPYKRDYILHKRRIILRSLLIVATPWHSYEYSYICEMTRGLVGR